MRFLDFQEQFRGFNTMTHQDVVNVFGRVNQSQLADWKRKGYIQNVRKGVYALAGTQIDTMLLANELNDSYISLESALAYHGIIPEVVPSLTSVSNERAETVSNTFGTFYYRYITPKLFTGFALVASMIHTGRFIRIAEPEKALFDLVYLREDLKDADDFSALRLNLEGISPSRIDRFAALVEAPHIRARLQKLVTYIHAHA